MDKNTLSNYGWIVIAVLVLSVMIALATPFGTYISDGVKATTQGLFDTQQKAMNTALADLGGSVADNKFDTSTKPKNLLNPETTSTGYMTPAGVVAASSSLYYTADIPVSSGDVVRLYTMDYTGSYRLAQMRFVTAFDTAGNVVEASGATNIDVYAVPENITHITVTHYNYEYSMIIANTEIETTQEFIPFETSTEETQNLKKKATW